MPIGAYNPWIVLSLARSINRTLLRLSLCRILAVHFIETTVGTGPRPKSTGVLRVLESVLRAIIPAANPDFECRYESVLKWWLELNPAGEPQRELGFDEHGGVIAAAPMGRNFGFFTDSNATFVHHEYPVVEQVLFEETWSEFERRFDRLHSAQDQA